LQHLTETFPCRLRQQNKQIQATNDAFYDLAISKKSVRVFFYSASQYLSS